jgi:hypothetical protein
LVAALQVNRADLTVRALAVERTDRFGWKLANVEPGVAIAQDASLGCRAIAAGFALLMADLKRTDEGLSAIRVDRAAGRKLGRTAVGARQLTEDHGT